MQCLSVEAKKRIISLHFCGKVLLYIYLSIFLAWLLHAWLLHALPFHMWYIVNYTRRVSSTPWENVHAWTYLQLWSYSWAVPYLIPSKKNYSTVNQLLVLHIIYNDITMKSHKQELIIKKCKAMHKNWFLSLSWLFILTN